MIPDYPAYCASAQKQTELPWHVSNGLDVFHLFFIFGFSFLYSLSLDGFVPRQFSRECGNWKGQKKRETTWIKKEASNIWDKSNKAVCTKEVLPCTSNRADQFGKKIKLLPSPAKHLKAIKVMTPMCTILVKLRARYVQWTYRALNLWCSIPEIMKPIHHAPTHRGSSAVMLTSAMSTVSKST